MRGDTAYHLDASEEAGDRVVVREGDVGDSVEGVNLPVELLHGLDGVRLGDLGSRVDPKPPGEGRWP